jgi:hypothetical protein
MSIRPPRATATDRSPWMSRTAKASWGLTPLLLACLAGCGAPVAAPWPTSGVYSGYYTYGYELSEFVPSGTSERWWLTGAVPCRPYYTKDTVANAVYDSRVRYIAVRGTLSGVGRHGHLGAYSRELTAQQFLECRELLPGERPKFATMATKQLYDLFGAR